MLSSGLIGRRGRRGPVEDPLNQGRLVTHLGRIEAAAQFPEASRAQFLGTGEVLHQAPGTSPIPKLVEARRQAGEGGFEVLADLATNQGHLEDEIATIANEELQGLPCVIKGRFPEGEAVDGGAMDRGQVGVVSFVTGVAGLTELLGGEGVDNADLEAGGGEDTLHGPVIAAGAFDRHQAVV